MTEGEFNEILIQEKEDLHLKVGDVFLTPKLAKQKSEKKAGDLVTVYMVIEVKENGNILYKPTYYILK